VRRPFATGLLEGGWTTFDIVIIGLATGSILFDGLSQTTPWFNVFGAPDVPIKTLQLVGFLGAIVGGTLVVARLVGTQATAAGLLPIAVGYLIAHYFTYLFIDGQRIIVAIADPLSRAGIWAASAGRSSSRRSRSCRPGLVWTIQIAAVVGGHMLGAWAGHVVYMRIRGTRRARAAPGGAARGDHGRADDADAVVAGPVADRRGAAPGRAATRRLLARRPPPIALAI
jgi:hypothetical protein